jgi:hypothetical protein
VIKQRGRKQETPGAGGLGVVSNSSSSGGEILRARAPYDIAHRLRCCLFFFFFFSFLLFGCCCLSASHVVYRWVALCAVLFFPPAAIHVLQRSPTISNASHLKPREERSSQPHQSINASKMPPLPPRANTQPSSEKARGHVLIPPTNQPTNQPHLYKQKLSSNPPPLTASPPSLPRRGPSPSPNYGCLSSSSSSLFLTTLLWAVKSRGGWW